MFMPAVEVYTGNSSVFNNDLDYVMLVGHFPELNDFLFMFTSEVDHMVTCAMAELKFDVNDWAQIGRDKLESAWFGLS